MTRKMISLAGALVAVISFGGADAEARHGGRQRHRCCQQQCHTGHQHHANHGYHNQGSNGQCCQQSGSNGYQQNANYGYRNDGIQQTSNYGPGQVTYGATAVAIDAGQPAPAVQVTAPVPNN
ncbi:MAG: hypothetical protein H7062_23200 [Candidatus Saccharimonas sp.]|nr:hypothetical protein [Planctomycetaceae bacterium]